MKPPRLLILAFLSGSLFVTGCGGAQSYTTQTTAAPHTAPAPISDTAPAPISDTAPAPTSDTAPAPTSDTAPAPDIAPTLTSDTVPATIPGVEIPDEAPAGAGGDTSRSEPELAAEEAPSRDDTPAPTQRDDNQTDTTTAQQMCPPGTAAPNEARIVEATVAPSLFVITEQGQSLTAEVLVELSDPTSEAPPVTVDRRGILPDVALSISDPECTELDTVWRWILTVSHPGRIILPPGLVRRGEVAVGAPGGLRLTVPFTVTFGDAGPVDLEARAFLAGRLGVAADEIEVAEVEPVTFNDGSMGCTREGYGYTAAEVPGFIVTLTHGAAVHVVHTDEHGLHFVVPANCHGGRWRPRTTTTRLHVHAATTQ